MSIRFPGVPEESVWNPNFSNHIAVKHKHLHWAVKLQTTVIPSLGKNYIYSVFLKTEKQPHLCLCLAESASQLFLDSYINLHPLPLFSFISPFAYQTAASEPRMRGRRCTQPSVPTSSSLTHIDYFRKKTRDRRTTWRFPHGAVIPGGPGQKFKGNCSTSGLDYVC